MAKTQCLRPGIKAFLVESMRNNFPVVEWKARRHASDPGTLGGDTGSNPVGICQPSEVPTNRISGANKLENNLMSMSLVRNAFYVSVIAD